MLLKEMLAKKLKEVKPEKMEIPETKSLPHFSIEISVEDGKVENMEDEKMKLKKKYA
jgi:hypothetical protein